MPSVISAIDYATPKRPCKTHIRPRARLHFCHPHRNPNRNPNANPNGIAGTLVRSNWQPLNGKWPCWLLVTSWFPIHFPSTLHFGEMRLVINPKFSFTRRHMGLQSLSLAFSICPLGQIFAHKSNTRLRRRMTSFTNSIAYYTRISSHLAWLRMLFLLLFNFPPDFIAFTQCRRQEYSPARIFMALQPASIPLSLHCCTLRIRDMWCRAVAATLLSPSSARAAFRVSQCWHNVAK